MPHPPILKIETRILGFSANTSDVPLPSERINVADLVRAKIAAEWKAYERGERAVVGRESLAPELLRAENPPAPVNLEASERAALDGYRSGWYIILVDGEEPSGLDTVLHLTADSRIAFVRVYPLP